MRKPGQRSIRTFTSVDERVKNCPSWVQQDFAKLDAACHEAAREVTVRDAARSEGRVYYCGARHVKFCRIDPNTRRIGVWFRNDIRDRARLSPSFRPNRPDGPWIYVSEEEPLDLVVALIRESSEAALSK
jgi:hypothetical protein